jgi:hypothetical protein
MTDEAFQNHVEARSREKQIDYYSQLVNLQENAALMGIDVELGRSEYGSLQAKLDGYTVTALTVPALVQGCYQVITGET